MLHFPVGKQSHSDTMLAEQNLEPQQLQGHERHLFVLRMLVAAASGALSHAAQAWHISIPALRRSVAEGVCVRVLERPCMHHVSLCPTTLPAWLRLLNPLPFIYSRIPKRKFMHGGY